MGRTGSYSILILAIVLIGYYFYQYEKNHENRDYLILYGNVDVRQVDLGFRVSGRVDKMTFEEGDFVPEGTLMAALDFQPYADQVLQAQASNESSKVSLENAEKIYKRRTELINDGSVSREDFENALLSLQVAQANLKGTEASYGVAKTNLNDTHLYAPNDGTILTRIREPGTVVKAADPIYTLSLISPVWIRAYVSEPDLGRIYPDMSAEIYTDTPGGKVYSGHIGFISPIAEFTPKTVETTQLRTDLVYRLRIIADNPDQALKQGMPVTVKLKINRTEEKK